jgi:exonuclease SbcC
MIMKLLRKLFGVKPKVEPVKAAQLPVAEAKPPKPVITLDAVEQTNNEQELLKLAIEGATSQLRQAAAEKLHSREILEQVAKAVKTKDKNVYKIIKNKLEILKAEDNKNAEL